MAETKTIVHLGTELRLIPVPGTEYYRAAFVREGQIVGWLKRDDHGAGGEDIGASTEI